MSEKLETTIAQVIGASPWTGPAGAVITSETRPAVRTFLSRLDWKADVVLTMTLEDLAAVYTSAVAYEAKTPAGAKQATRAEAQAIADAPYAPRNAALLAYMARKGQGEAGANFPRVTPIVTDAEDENEAPRAVARAPKTNGDDASALADAIRRIAGAAAGPLDEARVIELVKAHAPKPADNIIIHRVEVKTAGDVVKIEGAQHPKLGTLAKAMAARMTNGFAPNVMLVGPTASGKTHAVEQIAAAMARPFYMHGAMAMAHELMGFKDAAGNLHRTPFRDAFENGGIVLLDDLDSWDSAVTLVLNAALADGQCAFPDGMVKRHEDCIIVGAGNTHGTGPTAEFVGRNRLDAAFMSRFPVRIEWPRDPAIERAIAANDDWTARVTKARDRAAAAGIKHLIDPRHSQAGAALIAAGLSPDDVAEITYLAGLQDAQRRTVEGR